MTEGARPPLRVRPDLEIPADELRFEAVRSGGPGGQNVNKVATAVVLHFGLAASRALTDWQKHRVRERMSSRIDAAGDVVVRSSRFREQRRNLDDALERLAELLRAALTVEARRVATRPTRASKRRRLADKRAHSERKQGRRAGDD